MPFCQMAQRNLPVTRKRTNKGLIDEKVLRRRVGIFKNFFFQNFDRKGNISQKYKKDGHFDEKRRKNRTTTNIVKNGRTRDEKKTRSFLSWQQHTIRPLSVDISGEGSFSGEGIFHGTLPYHKLEEIRALSQEDYGSRGLVPQRLFYVKGLYKTDFVATWMS